MSLKGALELIDEDVSSPEDRAVFACLASYVFRYHSDLKHLTYSRIASIAGTQDPCLILRATQYLSGERVRLLRMKFELILGDESYYLDDETIHAAEHDGVLIHPETGLPVDNYEKFVYPFFVPGEAVISND
jgi:hypothetical protein